MQDGFYLLLLAIVGHMVNLWAGTPPLKIRQMDRLREIYLRRADLFLDPNHFNLRNIHQHLFERRDGTAVGLKVWSAPTDKEVGPPKFVDAVRQEFRLAAVGDSFGPSWSTHWFRVKVSVPEGPEWAGKRLTFRWESGCEAMVWSGAGVPLAAFSEQERDDFLLSDAAQPGDTFTFYIVH